MSGQAQKTEKKRFGDLGEEIAARYLADRGFSILQRNYWKPWGEIDIVASKAGAVHFFEVKTGEAGSGSRETFRPENNLHEAKVKKFERVVQTYLWERRIDPQTEWHVEALCVLLDTARKQAHIERIKDIISS